MQRLECASETATVVASPRQFPLLALLRKKGMSSYRLAKLTGIPLPMVSRLLKPSANPTWQTILRILDALGLTISFATERSPKWKVKITPTA